ncbi:MAG: MOP flippase family protein [Bacteroidota bacterium]|nr:MOP flippase family protein [Bacteroidota bacterium]MDP4204489.1 MOP flippase family protein [Bacteroidota bacterium]
MSFKNGLFNGIKWTTLSSIINVTVKLLQVIILTRYLSKSDFGVVAIALLFIQFTDIFLEMGLTSAILHKQNITRNEYSSLFWLNIISGILIYGILILLTPLISMHYKEPILNTVIPLLGLNIVFSSIGRQQRTIEQKNLRFKVIALVEIFASVVTFIVALILAITGKGIYSLVFSTIIGLLFSNLVFFFHGILVCKNVGVHFSFTEVKSFLKIGGFQLGTSMLDFLSREADIIIISNFFSKEFLGVYSLSKQLVMRLYGFVNPIMTKVLTPLLASMQNKQTELKSKYLKVIEFLSFLNYPLYFLIALNATPLLILLYGKQYAEGGFILAILSVNYGILSIANPVGSLQVALGRTDLGFYWTIYRVIVSITAIYIGSLFSIQGVVWSILICNILNILPFWRMQLYNLIRIKLLEYLKFQYIPFILSLILFVIIRLIPVPHNNILSILIYSTLFTSAYLLILKKNLFSHFNYISKR